LTAVRRQFPNEHFVYLGDTARLPYGTKSQDTIFRYTLQNIQALKKMNVKAIVVACNSASTAVLKSEKSRDQSELLQNALTYEGSRLPLYNVIEPGAQTALEVSANKRIAVLGTRATIESKAYVNVIESHEKCAVVFQAAAPLLVPLVEEGWEDDPITNLIVYRYLAPLLSNEVDTLILGCTHYPALSRAVRRVTGLGIHLVDSALAIAKLLENDFNQGRLQLNSKATSGSLTLLATDTSPSMSATARRLMSTSESLDFKPFDIV
jgi:glutamate racemase